MESREGCSYSVVLTVFGGQGEVGREILEFKEKVWFISSLRRHNRMCRCGLCQEEGPLSHTRRDRGEIASGVGLFTGLVGTVGRFPCNCLFSPWRLMQGTPPSPVREVEGN